MLSNSTSQLIEALNLLDVSSEEDLGPSLLALLTTARESSPKIPLSRIAHEIFTADAASLLDPLDTLPVLLPCKDPAAREILSFIGECGSAKETLMAIQEAAERLISSIDKEDEDGDITPLSFPSQLVILVDLYTACAYNILLSTEFFID
ncbi:hypothetical protein H0H87_009484 [Tephrocybe sp. NHM501043]|nr:hypothetical protein H0H87_009484 [Tephrocybe sp. NHM501043]